MKAKIKKVLAAVVCMGIIFGTVSMFKWEFPIFPDPVPITPGFVLQLFSFL